MKPLLQRGPAAQCRRLRSCGRASAPRLSAQVAGTFIANGPESIGAEAPPTKRPGSPVPTPSFLWEGLQPRGCRLRSPEPSSRTDRKASGLKPLLQDRRRRASRRPVLRRSAGAHAHRIHRRRALRRGAARSRLIAREKLRRAAAVKRFSLV
ncbi:DUF6053 domain-containing protein [Lysobacter enzymogenes]|uniref:DUF6053 domain-containing protein n=1 Tax=Lysobacter enzymogenes TaxID=69 RepID=UPI003D18AD0D